MKGITFSCLRPVKMVASFSWFKERRRTMNQTGNDILLSHEVVPKETKKKKIEKG